MNSSFKQLRDYDHPFMPFIRICRTHPVELMFEKLHMYTDQCFQQEASVILNGAGPTMARELWP